MILYTYIKDSFQIFHVTLFFYKLDFGFYNLAMEGRFLLIPVDLKSLQLLLKCLNGFTIFTPYLNFLYFDKMCGFKFLHYSVFIYPFLLSVRYYICFQKNQVLSVVFNAASVLHTTWHTYNNKERDTTPLAFIPLMMLALIGWRTHDQTVLYNWRVAKYSRHDIFNRDELTGTE